LRAGDKIRYMPNWIEENNERLKKTQKAQRTLSEAGGPVSFDDGNTNPSEGAEAKVNVRGRGRKLRTGPIQRLFHPHATIYTSREGETAVPGRRRGLETIGLVIMRALGASRDLISATRKAQSQDFERVKKQVGVKTKKKK